MDTSTTTFCRFSPLRTPSIKQKSRKKYDSSKKDVSDTESLVSVVTSEIRKIAHSVQDRLKRDSEISIMSSDDDIFISQSKKLASSVKSVKKRVVSDSDSDSINLDSSSESEPDTVTSQASKTSKMLTPKKTRKVENEDVSPKKKLKLTSPMKSSLKTQSKRSNHEISESSDDSRSTNTDSSKERKSSVSSVRTSSTDSSDRRRGSASSIVSSNSSEGRKEKPASGLEDSDTSDSSGSDSDRSSIPSAKGRKIESLRNKHVTINTMSEDSDFETSQSQRNLNKSKKTDSKKSPGKSGSKNLRYKIPERFELDTSTKYLSKSDIQGKQLWLVTAPDDLEISVLNRQKINMTGSSIVTAGRDEEQFEVVARPFTSEMSSYSCAASQASGSEEFVLGPQINGQLQVMGWIPVMPQVELAISPPKKHRVPDDLKPTFVPFGSTSPDRQKDEECMDRQKREKHKKKKKKKDKRKA